MKKILALTLTLAMTLSLLAGCSSGSSSADGDSSSTSTGSTTSTTTSSSTEAEAAAAEKEEQVLEAVATMLNGPVEDGEPVGIVAGSSVNTYLASDSVTLQFPGDFAGNMFLYHCVYEGLFYSPSGNFDDIQGLVVENYTVSEDGCTWVFDLHDDIYYNNGTNMTAEKVKRCFEIQCDTGRNIIMIDADMEVTGEHQLTCVFPAPVPELMYQAAGPHSGLFDPTLYDELGDCTEAAYLAGSGPYYISDYAAGDYLTLTANENYWNADRMAHIETINNKVILSTDTQVTSLMSGEMDIGNATSYSQYETLMSDNDLNITEFFGTCRSVWFNASGWGCEYLSNARVREALCLLVDMDEVAMAATGGYGESTKNAFSPTLDYTDSRTYDPEAGLAILAEEGVDPADIVIQPICTAEVSGIYSNIQAQLSAYGISVDFAVQDSPAVSTAAWAGEWDMWTEHGGVSRFCYASGVDMMFGETGRHNVCHDVAEVDELLWELVSKTFSALTYEEEQAGLVEILEVLDTTYAYMGNVRLPNWQAASTDLHNVRLNQWNGSWMAWEAWV